MLLVQARSQLVKSSCLTLWMNAQKREGSSTSLDILSMQSNTCDIPQQAAILGFENDSTFTELFSVRKKKAWACGCTMHITILPERHSGIYTDGTDRSESSRLS